MTFNCTTQRQIAVIGGGAAGFFAAISAKQHYPAAHVALYEKTSKVLRKVKISGGGRCNVTNSCASNKELIAGYPRGGRTLKNIFAQFNNQDTIRWFESRGVKLKTEKDGRMFPVTDDSQTIIDCLLAEISRMGVSLKLNTPIINIFRANDQIQLETKENHTILADKVIVCTGGSPKKSGFKWLENLGLNIVDPIPSLFTFNMPNEGIKNLMGVVADKAHVRIEGSKLVSQGPLLITHWGMSGPAILKLSSFGARELYQRSYIFTLLVNWISITNNDDLFSHLEDIQASHPKKKLSSIKPYFLKERLWLYLLDRVSLRPDQLWGELGRKSIHKLVHILTNDRYRVQGKTTFKEEFVTCGGVNLTDINMSSMQSKLIKGLYFAGEVVDIDGITGGYNFQAAWSTGFIAGQLKRHKG